MKFQVFTEEITVIKREYSVEAESEDAISMDDCRPENQINQFEMLDPRNVIERITDVEADE